MKTKSYHAFLQKLDYFNDDIELIDVLKVNVLANELTEANGMVLKGVNTEKYPHLSRRKNSHGSRKNIMHHLRSTVYAAYVKDIYEEVTHYLRSILNFAAEKGLDSGRVIGDYAFKIDAKDVLRSGNWEKMVKIITDQIFQRLESERSTIKLIKDMPRRLGLDIPDDLINESLPYLEVRHLLVHSDGKTYQDFRDKFPKIRLESKGYVLLDHNFIFEMRDAVKKLVESYDREVIRTELVDKKHTQP
ncbi:hypothetical protein [Citrobacter portucalensis]|uniref:hypothetical protein n=1 Tax=Citrobacter portucalensis TaxID=1639133 RepID=UPI0039F54441